ncbi:MAG: YkoF family thiamine/hydroxymethylpyrimidine-binding protein [Haliea sp.]|uniref:YkoF family thiamine/hydroxymethylpyrimidine-binding protein n=1 Tax=Haliea sp. TaxID=1932666 RepID=UPI0032EACEAF
MHVTAELSLYPLQADYIPVIKGFIERLAASGELTLVTNAMSTQISGEAEQVFSLVREALTASHAQFGKQVLVCKFIPGLLSIRD